MSSPVDVILCGAGRMGKNHLRVLSESPDFRLRAIVDPVLAARSKDVSGVPVVAELADVPTDYAAAVVATPTETHHGLGRALLGQGKHVLLEKPFASTVQQCNELIALAETKGSKVAIGHVERFNPVVRKVADVLQAGFAGTPIHFSFTRVGGYPESVRDGNNVLLDLAVHDLDILYMLSGRTELVASVCHDTLQEKVFDTAEMLLKTAQGASASVHVNWLSPTKIRTLRVTGSKGVLFADLILQTCTIYGGNLLRRGPEPSLVDFSQLAEDYRNSDKIEFNVRKEEPLRGQLSAFRRFLDGEVTPICQPVEATRAVQLAIEALAKTAHADTSS